MSSGRSKVQMNTRERVVSGDINRLQTLAAGFQNEMLRRMVLAPVDDSLAIGTTFPSAGALTAAIDVIAPAAPAYAGVLNGLMVIVPAAATYILISAGMLEVVDPEGQAGSSEPPPTVYNPDDGPGPARTVYSPGVSVAGTLNWTANPGPGVRVDIVECQRTSVVSETDNRDIFDPATGLFTAVAVTKVTTGGLTFRIRQGVAGGGLPAPATGWVPLAVLASAAGSVSLDDVEVWDVRPLLSDLSAPFAQVRSIYPHIRRYGLIAENKTVPAEMRLSGESQGDYLGWRIGGFFQEPSVAAYVDLNDSTYYQAAGFVAAPSAPYYVYALWPGGYVRWVRYHSAPLAGLGGRGPGSFRGIITVSQVACLNGQPVAPVATPSGWGLGVSTVFGQMLAAGAIDAGGNLLGFVADNEKLYIEDSSLGAAPASLVDPDIGYVFTPGVHFPAGAKRLRVAFLAVFDGLAAAGNRFLLTESVQIVTAVGANLLADIYSDTKTITRPFASALIPYQHTIDIPIVNDGISVPPAIGVKWTLQRTTVGDGIGTILSASAIVIGWDLLCRSRASNS